MRGEGGVVKGGRGREEHGMRSDDSLSAGERFLAAST